MHVPSQRIRSEGGKMTWVASRPNSMRPVSERILYSTKHFHIYTANTTPAFGWSRRGCRFALIEPVDPAHLPTRIDPRLKSIKQIIAVREVFNRNSLKGYYITRRYVDELIALLNKCERLWPCHFLIKGVTYRDPPAHLLDSSN